MRTFTLDQQRKNRKTVYTLYEIGDVLEQLNGVHS